MQKLNSMFQRRNQVVSQSLIGQTLLLNLTGDELGHGGRDQQDSGSQGSQKMSGSATKKSGKLSLSLILFSTYDISGSLRHPEFTLTYLR